MSNKKPKKQNTRKKSKQDIEPEDFTPRAFKKDNKNNDKNRKKKNKKSNKKILKKAIIII